MMTERRIPAETVTLSVQVTDDPADRATREALLADPGFGTIFGEHMVRIDYVEGDGWGRSRLVPYAEITLQPTTAVFHYAQSVFEGLKAYRLADGGVGVFRPGANGERLNRSCERLAIPGLPVERFVEAIDALVTADSEWVPSGEGQSLYLRPIVFATDPVLIVRPSRTYSFFLVDSPSGAYFAGGVKPVTVWVSEDYSRAAPGGTGFAKTSGNYAASLAAHAQALDAGCDQVVWLDAIERNVVEEMGGMNLFFVYGDERDATLVTPALTGTLLPGITRDSILTLARDRAYAVEERRITMDEWREANATGAITEVFACGTAAVITPVGHVKSRTGEFRVADGEPGPIATGLRAELLDLQHGAGADPHGWLRRVV
jgi:branched-chain amino acid aminotransferase